MRPASPLWQSSSDGERRQALLVKPDWNICGILSPRFTLSIPCGNPPELVSTHSYLE